MRVPRDKPVHVHVDDLRSVMGRLSAEEGGVFITLFAHCFSGEPLTDNDDQMASLLGISLSVWRRVKPKVIAEFDTSGPSWRPRIRFIAELEDGE